MLALADNSPGAHHRERMVPAGDALNGSWIAGPWAYIQHVTTLQHFEGSTLLTSRRSSDREFARFVKIARGSAHELEFQVLAATDLGLLDPGDSHALLSSLAEVSRMLHALAARLSS